MKSVLCTILALILVCSLASDASAKCKGGRKGGRGGRKAALVAELELERDQLLLQQGLLLAPPRLGSGLNVNLVNPLGL